MLKNAKKWTFLKMDPGSGINLGYLCNPAPPPPELCRVWCPCMVTSMRLNLPKAKHKINHYNQVNEILVSIEFTCIHILTQLKQLILNIKK